MLILLLDIGERLTPAHFLPAATALRPVLDGLTARCVEVIFHPSTLQDSILSGNNEWETRSVRNFVVRAIEIDQISDLLKGSYYANPIIDSPQVSAEDQANYPEYYGHNICKFPSSLLRSACRPGGRA